jgi:nucleotide-binding universal stress UspA family protein
MKILVGYNGSTAARAALDLALGHAGALGADVIVVTSAVGGAGESEGDISHMADILSEARRQVEAAGGKSDVRELIRGMSPGEDMVAFAEENEVNLIYVGVEKRSKVQKMLLGSNAQYVILNAPCPVMTVKPK